MDEIEQCKPMQLLRRIDHCLERQVDRQKQEHAILRDEAENILLGMLGDHQNQVVRIWEEKEEMEKDLTQKVTGLTEERKVYQERCIALEKQLTALRRQRATPGAPEIQTPPEAHTDQEETESLKRQLNAAMAYRKRCTSLQQEVADLRLKLKVRREGPSVPPSSASLAGVAEGQTEESRIAWLEGERARLLYDREILKAAYKEERAQHKELRRRLEDYEEADRTGLQQMKTGLGHEQASVTNLMASQNSTEAVCTAAANPAATAAEQQLGCSGSLEGVLADSSARGAAPGARVAGSPRQDQLQLSGLQLSEAQRLPSDKSDAMQQQRQILIACTEHQEAETGTAAGASGSGKLAAPQQHLCAVQPREHVEPPRADAEAEEVVEIIYTPEDRLPLIPLIQNGAADCQVADGEPDTDPRPASGVSDGPDLLHRKRRAGISSGPPLNKDRTAVLSSGPQLGASDRSSLGGRRGQLRTGSAPLFSKKRKSPDPELSLVVLSPEPRRPDEPARNVTRRRNSLSQGESRMPPAAAAADSASRQHAAQQPGKERQAESRTVAAGGQSRSEPRVSQKAGFEDPDLTQCSPPPSQRPALGALVRPQDRSEAAEVATPTSKLAGARRRTVPAAAAGAGTALNSDGRLASVRGNGVLETLHILDMHQGLSAGGASPAAQKPAEQPKRLPSVVDRAPFKAKKPAPPQAAAPPDPRNGEPGYKYREVVRKKADREQLPGFGCQDCEGFYRAVQSWGMANCQLPKCGHQQGKPAAAAAATVSTVEELRQDGSRHRFRFKPPATPEGFWDMGFMDSQDSRMQQ